MLTRSGDLIFVRNKGLLFRVIRRIVGCYYDHVAVFVADDVVVEANPSGVISSTLNEFTDRMQDESFECVVYRYKGISVAQREKIVDSLLDKVGQKYDYLQILGMWIMLLFRIPRKHKPLDSSKAWTCVELVSEAYLSAGLTFSNRVNPNNINTADMLSSGRLEEVSFKQE